MQHPEGVNDETNRNHVYLLKKFLYGLKQSLRQWYIRFDSYMIDNSLCRSNYNNCVYYNKVENMNYLLLCVDDMLIASKEGKYIDTMKSILKSKNQRLLRGF